MSHLNRGPLLGSIDYKPSVLGDLRGKVMSLILPLPKKELYSSRVYSSSDISLAIDPSGCDLGPTHIHAYEQTICSCFFLHRPCPGPSLRLLSPTLLYQHIIHKYAYVQSRLHP